MYRKKTNIKALLLNIDHKKYQEVDFCKILLWFQFLLIGVATQIWGALCKPCFYDFSGVNEVLLSLFALGLL